MKKLFSILFFHLSLRPNCSKHHKYRKFCILNICLILFCVFFNDVRAQNNFGLTYQNDIEKGQVVSSLILSNGRGYANNKINVQSIAVKSETQDSFFFEKQVSYISVSLIIFVLAIVLKFLLLPEMNFEENKSVKQLSFFQKVKDTLMQPQLVLALIVLILYFYISSEILAGNSFEDFVQKLELYVVKLDFYQKLILFTMTAMVIGCVLGMALIPKYVSLTSFLKLSCFLGVLLAVTILFISPCIMIALPGIPELPVVIILVGILGFVNALFWPVIWSIVLRDFRDL